MNNIRLSDNKLLFESRTNYSQGKKKKKKKKKKEKEKPEINFQLMKNVVSKYMKNIRYSKYELTFKRSVSSSDINHIRTKEKKCKTLYEFLNNEKFNQSKHE